MFNVDNAVIMAAGTSSRFAPLSYENPKSLTVVKGEILIERQIRQLKDAGIHDVILVTGYKKEKFEYLKNKFGVRLIQNNSYLTRNNNASIYAVKDFLHNTYICSCDNYFFKNPFERQVDESYYSAKYAAGETHEWCLETDKYDYITNVTVGGRDSWHMLGHTFWSEDFSKKFLQILENVYEISETYNKYWEDIYIENISELKMKIRKYPSDVIFEFDSLDDLREFDESYWEDSRSAILKSVAGKLSCQEKEIIHIAPYKDGSNEAVGFTFTMNKNIYQYNYSTKELKLT